MRHHLSLTHPLMLEHGDQPEHPESRSRLEALLEFFRKSPFASLIDDHFYRLATEEDLAEVHDQAYVKKVLSLAGENVSLDSETILSKSSVEAARLAAGIGLELVEQVVSERLRNGFALIRPPGHHAGIIGGMGFCIFNNIAIAAKKALSLGLKRVAIVDWDVHHGNGTEEIFYDDERVFFIDFHQENLFPKDSGSRYRRGKGRGIGYTLNIPLKEGAKDMDYLEAFDRKVKGPLLSYSPELILVSAGFDAHQSDPLGFMKVSTEGFGLLTQKVKAIADQVAKGKLILFLEGGYNPYWLAKNVLECVHALAYIRPKFSSNF